MKISMYFNYTARALLRGGQRTVLAVFCVAVGVMAIVALQLVGFMLQNSLTANLRTTNGGDITVMAQGLPLKESDLSFFAQLKNAGTITNYTALSSANGTLSAAASSLQAFSIHAVDPKNYPLVSQPTFVTPNDGSIAALLTQNQVLVTQNFLDRYHKKVGDRSDVYIKTQVGTGQTLHVTIAGVMANTGVLAQAGNLMLISTHDYQAQNTPRKGQVATYSTVNITTETQMQTDAAVKAVNQQFPFAATQTVSDVLKTEQASIDNISKFLEIAGLLALLIGGVGIINTMQVLLSRRKTEIAMLKTTGYRRMDLYTLFGLEAGVLGLVGGIVGAAAAIGVSYLVGGLMQNLGVSVTFLLDPWIVVGGIAIGCVTALIFGLMPIVQAANIRPLNVIREMSAKKSAGSMALTLALLILLSLLFCILAIVILKNDVLLGIEAVYGTFAFLLLLSIFFGLIVFIISKLPVPEHFSLKYAALIIPGLVAATLLYMLLPVFGILLFAITVLGILVVLLPRSWKVSTKMALRNIGRQRTRTTTTIVALFIGVFTIGLVLALGQDLQAQLSNVFANKLAYNIITTTSGTDTATLRAKSSSIQGIARTRNTTFTQTMPTAINGQPLLQTLPAGNDRQAALSILSTMEGYDLAHNVPTTTITQGRTLNANDAGTGNIVISQLLTGAGPFHMHMKIGDSITFARIDSQMLKTATVVGIYTSSAITDHVGNVLAASATVAALTPASQGTITVTYMKIEQDQVNNALNTFGKIIPNAQVQNLADIGTYFAQQLNSIVDILAAVASLSMIAGVIIIANAVALAMLERRRELGILKAVGYTSSTVLSVVMIENGIIGGVGAFMAMLVASGTLVLLGKLLFNLAFSVSAGMVIGLIGGSALLALLIAALVAWGSVRVRPLEVLRYE